MNKELIEQLAQARGIEGNYVDAWGKDAAVNPESKLKLLAALGYPIDNDDELKDVIQAEAEDTWCTAINNVQVIRQTDELSLEVRLPITVANHSFNWTITEENGQQTSGQFIPVDGDLINVSTIDDVEYQEYLIEFPHDLSLGYHTLSISSEHNGIVGQQCLIVAPLACYKQDSIADGKRVWGPSVQLYCVRSESNWGVGDFGDLELLIKEIALRGADFVGLNPIHALYPANAEACSPYSPSSRRWLNSIYIDVTQVEGYQDATVQSLINTDSFKEKQHQARETEWIDYPLVTELKMAALNLTFDYFRAKCDQTAFQQFINDGGDSLQQIAIFDAIQQKVAEDGTVAWGWPAWPDDLNEYHKPAVAEFAEKNKRTIEFFCYLQWLASTQIDHCQHVAIDAGMDIGIYRDLAVGVSEGSSEIWGNRDLYCTDISVGAPPDVLGPQGQSWGLPPMDPEKLYQQNYQPIVDLFRSNMSACGALRIDHAMALLRLWWVPKHDSAQDGAYIYYPVDDLLALLALESHRNQCLVIGEDLGTVPDGIPELLAENGIHSYRVFFFETAEDGGYFSPSHYPEQAMATLTTHDMPTLRGYWHCTDLEMGKDVGVYPDEVVRQELFASRHQDKQQILNSLHGHGISHHVPHDVNFSEMTLDLNQALQMHMANVHSSLLSLQLEDWMQMDKPVNIPGTSTEYPNWRRKLTQTLETLFENEDVNQLTRRITEQRSSIK